VAEEPTLTHLSDAGEVHMVDVGAKSITDRVAAAEALVMMSDSTRQALFSGTTPKGDALAAARLAGIMAAKRTSDLIPLCHPIPISAISVEVAEIDGGARIEATVKTSGRTGVEMEAMTAVSVAALTLYDMVKGIEKGVQIGSIRLLHKSGGRSGEWNAE
jgi:cyclic pyranopterin phosphate synthase